MTDTRIRVQAVLFAVIMVISMIAVGAGGIAADDTSSDGSVDITVEDAADVYPAQELDDPGDQAEYTPASVSLSGDYEEDVRIDSIEGVDGLSLWAQDSEGDWHDITQAGWGPDDGFPIDEDAETEIYPAGEEGTYTFDITVVDADDDDEEIATEEVTLSLGVQDAIDNDDAHDGDTLALAGGTYEEAVTVDVEGLKLEAADGGDRPTISYEPDSPSSEKTIRVNADDVVLERLNIERTAASDRDSDSGFAHGVVIRDPDGGEISGVTVFNVEVYGDGFDDDQNNRGLQVLDGTSEDHADASDIEIAAAVVTGFDGGISVGASYGGTISDVDVIANELIEGHTVGFDLSTASLDGASAGSISDDAGVTVTDNNFGQFDGDEGAPVTEIVADEDDSSLNLDFDEVLTENDFSGAAVAFDNGGAQTYTDEDYPGFAFASVTSNIQSSLDIAEEGDTVEVAPGDYGEGEALTVDDEDVTVRSLEGPDKAVIDPEVGVELKANNARIERFEVEVNDIELSVFADAPGVEIVDNVINSGTGQDATGVLVNVDDVVIEDNEITGAEAGDRGGDVNIQTDLDSVDYPITVNGEEFADDKTAEASQKLFDDNTEIGVVQIGDEEFLETDGVDEIQVSDSDALRDAAAGEEVDGEVVNEGGTIVVTEDIDLGDSNVRVTVDGVTLKSDEETREISAESSGFPGSSDRGLIQVLADDVIVEELDLYLDDEGEGAGIPVINIDGDEADSAAGAIVREVHAERVASEDSNFAQVINIVGEAPGATITENTLTGEGEGLNQGLTIQQVEDGDLTVTDNEFTGEADIFLGLPDTTGTIEDNEFDASDSVDDVEAYVLDASQDLGDIQADQSEFDPAAFVNEGVDITTGGETLSGDALAPVEESITVETATELRSAAAGAEVNGVEATPDTEIIVTDDIDLMDGDGDPLGENNVIVRVDDVTITAEDDATISAADDSFVGGDRGFMRIEASGVTLDGLELDYDDDGQGTGEALINILDPDVTVTDVDATRTSSDDGNFAQVVNIQEADAEITHSTFDTVGDGVNVGVVDQAGDATITGNTIDGDADIGLTLSGDGATVENNDFEPLGDTVGDDGTTAYIFDFEQDTSLDSTEEDNQFSPAAVVSDVDFETGGFSIDGDALVPAEPAEPELSNLDIAGEDDDATITEGDDEPITVGVENIGDEQGTFTINLGVGDVDDSEEITLDSDSSGEVTFNDVTNALDAEESAYTVSVQDDEGAGNELTGDLTVEEAINPGIKHHATSVGVTSTSDQSGESSNAMVLSAAPENTDTMEFSGDADRSIEIRDTNSDSALMITPDNETTYDVDRVRLRVYSGDGTINEDPFVVLVGPEDGPAIDVDVEGDESIFTDLDSTFNGYELALIEDGEELATSDERIIGVNYPDRAFEQSDTEGEATITYPRDPAVNEDWFAEFRINDLDGGEITAEVDNTAGADEFEVTVDLDELEEGEYTPEIVLAPDEDADRGERIAALFGTDEIQVGDGEPDEADAPDVTLDTITEFGSEAQPIEVSVDIDVEEPASATLEVRDDDNDVVFEEDVSDAFDETQTTEWPTTDQDDELVADGEYTVEVTTEDDDLEDVFETVTVEADNSPPDVEVTDVVPDVTNEDDITVTIEVDAVNTPIEVLEIGVVSESTTYANTEVLVGDDLAAEDLDEPIEATIDTEEISEDVGDGEFMAVGAAVDAAGNVDTAEGDSVTVDTSAPEIQPRVTDLGESDATLTIESDEDVTLQSVDINAETESDSEDRSPSVLPERSDEFKITFDGTTVGEDDTTFTIEVDAEDDAGNEDTYELVSSLTGYELTDGEATVEPDSTDSAFDLSASDDAAEGDRSAAVGQTSSAPAGTSVDANQITEEFIDVTDIGLDETELEDATVRVPLEDISVDGFDEDDLVFFYSPEDDEDYEVLEPEIVDDELVVDVDGFSQLAPGGVDDQPPEITDVDPPDTEIDIEQDGDVVTVTFEYEAVISDIDVSATSTDVSVDDERTDVQITRDDTEVTVSDLEPGETFDVGVTVVDEAGNEVTETETLSVDDIEEEEEEETTARSGGGGGGGAATLTAPDGTSVAESMRQTVSDFNQNVEGTTVVLPQTALDSIAFAEGGLSGDADVFELDALPEYAPALDDDQPFVSGFVIELDDELTNESATLTATIPAEQVEDADADADDLVVLRVAGDDYEQLETTVESNGNVTVSAETPGFSTFIVTTGDPVEDVEETPEPEDTPEDTPEPEDTPVEPEDETPAEPTDDDTPGFGAVVALIALIAAALLATRRQTRA